jgi:hypothetical protein
MLMASRSSSDPIILAVLFVAAIIADGTVLYFIEEPGKRLFLGLLVLLPILWPAVWATRRLSKLGLFPQKPSAATHKRRYYELRKYTEQLLGEVSRLNWIAIDADRGFRSQDAKNVEVDAIKQRMIEIVDKMPEAAGHISDGPTDGEPVSPAATPEEHPGNV